jgi:hypothetical protein
LVSRASRCCSKKWKEGWRPKALAFYQGKVFGKDEAYKIQYFGDVSQVDIVPRKDLFSK